MKRVLWIPGPTQVRPEILAEMTRPQIGHRSAEMRELIASVDPGLALAFGLEAGSSAKVCVHTSSGTGLMEAALHGVGPRVLCVTCGAFGQRWKQIAGLLGKEVVALEAEWGEVVESAEIARTLDEQGPFDAVTLVANETSAGLFMPLDEIAQVMQRHPNTRWLLDVVSAIAGAPIDFDRRGIDFAFAGVQKALALPAGLAVACVSERYLEGARERERPSFYLDPVRILDGHTERKTPATPSIPHYYALKRQLEDISSAGWPERFAKHERMRARTLAWARTHDLETFPPRRYASPTVSCLRAGSIDVPRLMAGLEEAGHVIGNGYGRLKNLTFRVGHMGDHSEAELEDLLESADRVLG